MASRSLSVALVIDTASDVTAEALEAVQSGATEFLLRMPAGARSVVVASGGDPQVVAPLSPEPADALSAVSALRPEGARSTTAGTLLAAEELATAPPGPRAIIVYTHGSDEGGPSVEQLTQAVSRAEAVINVVQTDGDDLWSQVVDRTGGAVLRTGTAQVLQSYGRLATALGDQYLVVFHAPGELPAVAEVAVQTGDVQSRTEVRLPSAGTSADATGQPSERWPDGRVTWLILIVLSGIVLVVLPLGLRARRRTSVSSRAPSAVAAGPGADTASPDVTSASALPPAPATSPEPSAEDGHDATVVLTGSGDAKVDLIKNAPGPAVVHVTGNLACRYFGVRTLGTEHFLVLTLDSYDGVRSLDRDGRESTGFDVRATGAWEIEVLPLSAVPTFNTSFRGDGDMVVRFTGDGSLAEITGNNEGRYFDVRAFGAHGTDRLVTTTEAYSGSCQVSGGPQFFEIQAVGSWTVTVT
ncbi:MAG: vWA domain-containing protein [Jiangellaceae bacterium]